MPKVMSEPKFIGAEAVAEWAASGQGKRLSLGKGLYLTRGSNGGLAWSFVGTVGGKRKESGLGKYPDTVLAVARIEAHMRYEAAKAGHDFVHKGKTQRIAAKAKEKADSVTFQEVADTYVKDVGSKLWKVSSDGECRKKTEFERILRDYCKPLLSLKVQDVGVADVKACLTAPGIRSYPTMIKATASVIRRVIDTAFAHEWRPLGVNPASEEVLSKVLVVKHNVKSFASLDWKDAPAFYASLGDSQQEIALKLLMLTVLRRTETVGLLWSELDGDVLRIAAERMKANRPHIVPLPSQASALLAALGRGELPAPVQGAQTRPAVTTAPAASPRARNDGFVFPSPRRKGQSIGLSAFIKIATGKVTPHGMRATFRTWVEDNGHDETLAEHALAHQLTDSVQKAYRRSTAVERRRALMQAWADHLTGALQDEAKAA